MIVKFDHITYTCATAYEDDVKNMLPQYKVKFKEKNLFNIEIKNELMNKKQKYHNITMLYKDKGLPIELTTYDSCEVDSNVFNLSDTVISINTANKEKTEILLSDLGFNKETNNSDRWVLHPILDNVDILVEVKENNSEVISYLDANGFTSIAFIVINSSKYRQRLLKLGYQVSEINQLIVNNKELSIFFLIGYSGEIIEFISIKNNEGI